MNSVTSCMRSVLSVLTLASIMNCSDDSSAERAESDAATGSESCDVSISLIDYKLVPAKVTAHAGTIVLCAKNAGRAPHDLAVRDDAAKVLGKTRTLGPDEEDRFSLDATAGTFDIFCTQGGHESLGMKGTLTVD